MKEFTDFLGGQPPFDALDADDLVRLAAHVEVEYFDTGAVVVPEGTERLDHLWVVRTGALEVRSRGGVADLLGPGDMFGHTALLSELPAGLSVVAHEESLCLRIPDPRGYLAHPERLGLATTGPGSGPQSRPATEPGRSLTRVMRPVVWCRPDDPVRDVAAQISTEATSCALVRTRDGVGIVTDHDFRARVATGEVGLDAPVADLARVPALTVAEDATQAAALLLMMEHGVHHLAVVDGAGRPVGVVRVVDLAGAELRDPLLIRSAVEHADSLDELAEAYGLLPATIVELYDDRVPATRIGALHAAVVDTLVRRVLKLRADPLLTDVRPSWVLLGSLARREPLPRSDIDTALVWDDPDPAGPDPDATAGDLADRIRQAADGVLDDLRRCGLILCPNGTNADNPRFSRSRAEWTAQVRGWIHDPTRENALLWSAMAADSRPLTAPALGGCLTEVLHSPIRTIGFLRALLSEALSWRPPTGFVRDFVVAHSGEHRGQLDLKSGGLAPVTALARWAGIVTGGGGGTTTPGRLRRGVAAGLFTVDEADTLIGAFEEIYGLVLGHEVEAVRAGRTPSTYLAPRELDTLTRRHLRESFRAIASVQASVDQAWATRLPG